MANDNYPPGVNELPDDKVEEKEFNYEVTGGFSVSAYNEEEIESDMRNLLYEAYRSGTISVDKY